MLMYNFRPVELPIMEDTNTTVVNPDKIREADIILGTPSFDEVETISNVTTTADMGLREFFANKKAVIINADNHSSDGTKEAFLDTPTKTPKIYISTPKGMKGKGRNCRNLFRAAVELNAKAVVMVDADLTSFTPEWIQYFGEPLFCGFDYVSPIYERHKYDASITNHFACPFLRTLYGLRIRQPIGGDFGFSGKLAMAYLADKSWTENVDHFGIDIWMTTIAFLRGFKVCQTFLGSSKSHRVKDPARHLAPMFTHVIATIFDLMIEFEYRWRHVAASQPSSIFGYGLGVNEKPPVPSVDTDNLYNTFLSGYKKYYTEWQQVIPPREFAEIEQLISLSREEFIYPSRLWVRLLYNFAVAYRNSELPRQELIESMIPFYYSRMLSFVNKTIDWGTKECEDYLENIFRIYESEKPYLIQRWDEGKKRFLL
jgi:glycosyltransferase involved in cell wall biosynthesis